MINFYLIVNILFVVLMIYLLLKNRNIFVKLLVLNSLTSIMTLFICFLGSFKMNNCYLDIALIYFLLSFIASGAYLKYFIGQSNNVM
ncbi:monovalent cation/H+ antiporter complex subunit F [Rickettsia endosymbiont of Culicoides newsteadi]|uniref:monovalent cation/H+ antiporter complex subunit F n=1 Tax=Rickettsia endosymbiont of Culicoides newsteadi TaxID=1961830 RepID=UPI000B9C02FC|nr:monovalent cation/H+ antiporter complex subunit F [Rickettsia endosymbiont of Culicoides newsteadi]OZG31922.1 cation:proton antiporter [Rickettsia endosymbiont of Culicoides newsteadi]